MGEIIYSVFLNRHHILYSATVFAKKIYTGLNRYYITGNQNLIACIGSNRRSFVDLKTYSVTKGMTECSLIPCSVNNIACNLVHVRVLCAFGDGIDCRKLRCEIGKESILPFNVCQVICHVFSWGVIAPALDIAIYQEPMEKLFAQGLMAGVGNAVTTAIVGTLLCLAYAAAKPKAGSLTKDKE